MNFVGLKVFKGRPKVTYENLEKAMRSRDL